MRPDVGSGQDDFHVSAAGLCCFVLEATGRILGWPRGFVPATSGMQQMSRSGRNWVWIVLAAGISASSAGLCAAAERANHYGISQVRFIN